MYTVATAQLPEPPEGDDRLFLTTNSVTLLDGASAFSDGVPAAATYVEALGERIADALRADPDADLSHVLGNAITKTASALNLTPGHAPSSTVAIARWSSSTVDLLVLGDSQITTPHCLLRDDRLGDIATREREAYRTRLAAGHGYDAEHRALLATLQRAQAERRNRPGGYWIAEADPLAAAHALTKSSPVADTPWLVLASDGAYRPMERLGLAVRTSTKWIDLNGLLTSCRRWEAVVDPDGQREPRAKRHDDKTLAVLRRSSG